jgi:hypothetical protein
MGQERPLGRTGASTGGTPADALAAGERNRLGEPVPNGPGRLTAVRNPSAA